MLKLVNHLRLLMISVGLAAAMVALGAQAESASQADNGMKPVVQAGAAGKTSAETGKAASAGPTVNINTADEQTLVDRLNGIGPAKAKAIIEYRTKNGPFKSVEALTEVKGIGPATLEKNRQLITLQ